jgi:transcriptional regulator with XRE-family HTH domain
MDWSLPPTVSLDGNAVRRIREEKKLTQLYVAKMVRVTTDTISRWENNRTPSIKRENAQRLADALEVPLEEILQARQEEIPEAALQASSRRPLGYPLLILFLVALSAVYFLIPRRPEVPPVAFFAERWLPGHAAPGSRVPVQIRFDDEAKKHGFILREHFPPGWVLIEASPPASSLDNEGGMARWIIKPEQAPAQIAYLVRVAADAKLGGLPSFRGEVVAKAGSNSPFPVSGQTSVAVAPYLWADANGDNTVGDGEMLQASVIVEEMAGVHIDWGKLERIWAAGSYRWEIERQEFLPVKLPPEVPAGKTSLPPQDADSPSPRDSASE